MGDPEPAIDVLRRLEQRLHELTRDWPGTWPPAVEPVQAWAALGRPHTLLLWPESGCIERAWLTPDGRLGADRVEQPGSTGWQDAAALLPAALVNSLTASGCADDLVIAAPDELRALPYPMLPLTGYGERLNSFAAVTLLPSLSWGDQAHARRTTPARGGAIAAYIDPRLDLHRVSSLIRRLDTKARQVGSLTDLSRELTAGHQAPDIVLIGAHGTLTADGSIDVRDHTACSLTPEEFAAWPVPRAVMLVGCRTATGNGTAPLHLVEAALVAGAEHVIAVTAPVTDEVADRVLARVMVLLGVLPALTHSAMTPSQALQSALQQFDRAFPHHSAGIADWPIVHVGLPGSAL